ncbi:MAG: 3-isopropylmalate dehydratase large subunit [Thermoplasmatales archaeon]|nr:MAG: 3-isopropylmalate dehydratase large subunit [Thermoplasmatales archaeon]
MASTIAEKILARASGKKEVKSGEIVDANIDLAMSHDNTTLVSEIFKEIDKENVWNSQRIVIVLDHRTPANTITTAENHKLIREFVKKYNIKNFFDVGEGICHQVLTEKGFIHPGMLIVGTDSHTTTAGAFGAFATGIGATDMAAVWSTGKLWFKVPRTLGFDISGELSKYVTSKDIILYLIGKIGADGANYKACEFYGDTIENMSIDSRMVISNQAMEAGAKAAIIPPDKKILDYLKLRDKESFEMIYSDQDAEYEKTFEFDITNTEPQIACPDKINNVKPVSKLTGEKINQAVLGSCTNGRLEDFAIASDILKDKTISKKVRMIVVPASRSVYLEAIKKGYIEIFLKAGAIIVNPGCGPCLGLHQGVLADGESVISSTNRNYKGRMGASGAEIYLGSPATVAASAIKGEITNPKDMIL